MAVEDGSIQTGLLSQKSVSEYMRQAVLIIVFITFSIATGFTLQTVSKFSGKQLNEPLTKNSTTSKVGFEAKASNNNEESTFAVDSEYEKVIWEIMIWEKEAKE